MLKQQTGDRDKIYSLHEPQVDCLSKGKEHKKYEFGSKASVVMTKLHGVIVGAVAHEENLYAGDALKPALEQTRAITEQQPVRAIVDRGYRGRKAVNGTEVLLPGKPKPGQIKRASARMRARFRRRAAIAPLISHLKHQYRRMRCLLKGFVGDQINLLLAAAAWNLKKWRRAAALFLASTPAVHPQPTNPRLFIHPSVKGFFRSDSLQFIFLVPVKQPVRPLVIRFRHEHLCLAAQITIVRQ